MFDFLFSPNNIINKWNYAFIMSVHPLYCCAIGIRTLELRKNVENDILELFHKIFVSRDWIYWKVCRFCLCCVSLFFCSRILCIWRKIAFRLENSIGPYSHNFQSLLNLLSINNPLKTRWDIICGESAWKRDWIKKPPEIRCQFSY